MPSSLDLGETNDICAIYAYHWGTAISGDGFALRGRRICTIVDREIAGNCPLWSAYGLGGLIEFGGHIKIVDGRRSTVDTIETDQGVDLEVSEVEVDVDGVETNEEVHEYFLLIFGHVFEKGLSPDVARGERSGNADVEPKGFRVDVTNVDTTLVSEEDRITLTVRVDAHVELGV